MELSLQLLTVSALVTKSYLSLETITHSYAKVSASQRCKLLPAVAMDRAAVIPGFKRAGMCHEFSMALVLLLIIVPCVWCPGLKKLVDWPVGSGR